MRFFDGHLSGLPSYSKKIVIDDSQSLFGPSTTTNKIKNKIFKIQRMAHDGCEPMMRNNDDAFNRVWGLEVKPFDLVVSLPVPYHRYWYVRVQYQVL
jgi:hypothetical protein